MILRVAHLRDCRYEFEHHVRLGRRAGVDRGRRRAGDRGPRGRRLGAARGARCWPPSTSCTPTGDLGDADLGRRCASTSTSARPSSCACSSGTTRCSPRPSPRCASSPTSTAGPMSAERAGGRAPAPRPAQAQPRAGGGVPAPPAAAGHGRRAGREGLRQHLGGRRPARAPACRARPSTSSSASKEDCFLETLDHASRILLERVGASRRGRRSGRPAGSTGSWAATWTPWPPSRPTPACTWSRSTPWARAPSATGWPRRRCSPPRWPGSWAPPPTTSAWRARCSWRRSARWSPTAWRWARPESLPELREPLARFVRSVARSAFGAEL